MQIFFGCTNVPKYLTELFENTAMPNNKKTFSLARYSHGADVDIFRL